MSTAIAKIESNISTLATVQEVWPQSRKDFVRKNFCADAPDAIAESFLALCERRGLSPEERHIYLVPREVGKKVDGNWIKTKEYVPQTGIDGYRLIADRTGVYAGSDAPIFHGEGTIQVQSKEWNEDTRRNETVTINRKHPEMATVTVYKVVQGVRCPFTGVASWEEFNAGNSTWKKMPYVMLAKVAEAQALRKAFPADLSGLYTNEEMDQAGTGNGSFREVPTITPNTPQIAPESTETNDSKADESFEGRLADALEMPAAPQKNLFNELYKEAVAERHTDKLRLLIKFAPTYAQANNILNSATDRHGINTQAMMDALKNRDDAPTEAEFVDVTTGEIEA